MKKILFASYSLDVGGIETALVTLLKYLSSEYDITLMLERKQGIFLEQIPSNVNIITYEADKSKNKIARKLKNFIKQLRFKMKYKNKFDFSACYATYSFPCSFVARTASKNCVLWVHNNYMDFYNNNIFQYRKFFKDLHIEDYRKIVFVSSLDEKVFKAQFPEYIKKAVVCHNLINYKDVLKKANEDVDDFKKSDITTFINIGRHDEKQKKISRIISATRRLNKEGYKFRVVLVGKGSATKEYMNLSRGIKNIDFLGAKKNPYPYLKNSDCLLLSSQFEGYPVVFVESYILNKPIVTTDVSDAKIDVENKHGIVCENSEKGVYEGMKKFLEEGFETEKFDPENYNKEIVKKIEELIDKKG